MALPNPPCARSLWRAPAWASRTRSARMMAGSSLLLGYSSSEYYNQATRNCHVFDTIDCISNIAECGRDPALPSRRELLYAREDPSHVVSTRRSFQLFAQSNGGLLVTAGLSQLPRCEACFQ